MRDDLSPAHRKTKAAHEGGGLRLSASADAGEAGAVHDRATDDDEAFAGAAARRRLTSALLVKGAFDLLFVIGLAAAFYYLAFKPQFRGALERADAHAVEGWVFDPSAPHQAVEVQLYLDGEFIANELADRPRPELLAAGLAPHAGVGFVFRLDPPVAGRAVARVYAVGRNAGSARLTLQPVGDSLRIGEQ